MTDPAPVIYWVRRDLRLADNPALGAAVASGRPVIPVFIHDECVEALGAAPKWRLGLGVSAFAASLEKLGARLILRRGKAVSVLRALVVETGAAAVHWGRLYDPQAVARDTEIKAALKADGIGAHSHAGHLLFEPWTVQTGTGGFYRVFTPFWNGVRNRDPGQPAKGPAKLRPPAVWPASELIADWGMAAAMRRGAAIVGQHVRVGEAKAQARLAWFLDGPVQIYRTARDLPGADGTSRLSENLTYGEIGIRTVWHQGLRALHDGMAGAETFLKELVWRVFSYHLIHHTPQIAVSNWKPEWDAFPWTGKSALSSDWTRGRTGIQFVDAALREMYVTGTMHNRGRMIVASYLTKHLMTHWSVGQRWFAECLTDWDPAANAMGWQWAAGSGPDAAPYFRIFNPDTQAEKFDPGASYRRRFIAELSDAPGKDALDYFRAIPRHWRMVPTASYPEPIVALDVGRNRALAAYAARLGGGNERLEPPTGSSL